MKRYLPEYRVPASLSYYCLKHRVQYTRYHSIHIAQLWYLHRLSGDPYFDEMADRFADDFPYSRG